MAGTNEFLPTAVGDGSYVSSSASWQASARRLTGFQSGIVPGPDFNKAFRQPSVIASMIGSFIATYNLDARDDGDLAALLTNFQAAFAVAARAAAGTPEVGIVHYGAATGAANAYSVASLTPAVSALPEGTIVEISIPAANTGASTLTFTQFDPDVTRTICRSDGSALRQNDLIVGPVALSVRSDGRLSILNYNPVNAPSRNNITFRNSGNFVVPDGCYFIYAQVWGGGGGGGAGAYTDGGPSGGAGGGGAGGGYDDGFYFVTPGQTFAVTVGAGGSGGGGSGSGAPGGTSSIGALISATGGPGGLGALNGLQGTGSGSGGQGFGGNINAQGASGGTAFTVTPGNSAGASGGIGGAAPLGGGSPSLNIGGSGSNGNFPGGGANGSANNGTAGTGAPGLVRISF